MAHSRILRKFGVSDAIHKWIPFNQHEKKIIDSPLFQRLRHIKQLTMNDVVFPGANHTRFEHSLGVMHISTMYAETLIAKYPNKFDNKWCQTVRFAGLLHDVAHGPFSHAYDDFVYIHMYPNEEKGHDKHRMTIIQSDLIKTIIEDSGVSTEDIFKIWTGEDMIGGAILQGPVGADRIDFLFRDAHFTGVHSFNADYERIIHNVSLTSDEQYVAYPKKIQSQIESFLIGRYWMYDGVYLHKTVLACYDALKQIFSVICEPLNLIERTRNLNKFLLLTEDGLLQEAWEKVPESKAMINALKNRELPKLVEHVEKVEHETNSCSVIESRVVETLEKTKFKKYKIHIIDQNKEIPAHEYLTENGVLKDLEIKKRLIFKWDL